MNATLTQPSAHRAQSAARKPRWQPYSQSTSTLPTPIISTPKPSSQHPLPPATSLSSSNSFSQTPKDQPLQREVSRQKFALGLIDQAVKILSEIWPPEDIPTAFIGPTKAPSSNQSTSQPSLLVSTGADTPSPMLPLKNFVHEVLKRSRTSGSILQTALCYLEAIRSKIPEISCDEKRGIRSYFMPESTILPATEAELEMDKSLTNLESQQSYAPSDDIVKTVCFSDQSPDMPSPDMPHISTEFDGLSDASSTRVEPAFSTVGSAYSLPSPLLCPRRTLLAALILASKFSQDKCYSNRAWGKLSGLPPREIGRCERALGHALDWRLWVGKKTPPSEASVPPILPKITFPYTAPKCGSGSSDSSPHTPSLSDTPSTSRALTTQASSFEDSNYGCHPCLEIDGKYGFFRSVSPLVFDPKLPTPAHVELAGKLAYEMAQIAVANAAPDLLGIPLSGDYLLHADGNHSLSVH